MYLNYSMMRLCFMLKNKALDICNHLRYFHNYIVHDEAMVNDSKEILSDEQTQFYAMKLEYRK